MDIAPVHRTTPISDIAPLGRGSIQAAARPVPTDLPPSDTVQQGTSGFAAGAGDRRLPSEDQSPVVERNLSIDPDTQQIVYQAINNRGEIVLQLPDQAALRQRAYAREAEAAAEKASLPGTIERFV